MKEALQNKAKETTQRSAGIRRLHSTPSIDSPADRLMVLHKTIGNQAVQRLFRSGVFQAKLNIGQPNDVYEQEADRVAEQVMRTAEPVIQPKPT
jgi:hypothetical protein